MADTIVIGDRVLVSHAPLNGPSFAGNPHVLSFDGNMDYVSIPACSELGGAATLTVAGWFRCTALDATRYLFLSAYSSTQQFYATVGTTNLTVLLCDGTSASGYFAHSGIVNAGQWHHIAVVYNGAGSTNADKLKVYLDGVLMTLTFSGTIPAATPTTLASTRWGLSAAGSTNAMYGNLYDWRVYTGALSAANVQAVYVGGSGDYTTGRVHQWLLNEGSGAVAEDTGSNPKDGAITGATWEYADEVGFGTDFAQGAVSGPRGTTTPAGGYYLGEVPLYRCADGTLRIGGSLRLYGQLRLETASAPASATATGSAGEIRWDGSGYLYLCIATNTWVRAQLATWP